VQEWLLGHEAAPRYKAKIKSLLHRLFEKAMLWELIDIQRNPMSLVEIRGVSKRKKRPVILTEAQYYSVLAELAEPFRTMIVTAQCLGLRVSEILALKWLDIDFDDLTVRVVRKVVNGRVSRVKTEYSEDELPIDPAFATELRRWREQCPSSEGDWVFPNPASGNPYYASEIGKRHLRSAGEKAKLEYRGQPIKLGWHTFRHTYRAWLDATGTPVGVQQKLMRHANVSTTMDTYGNALMESKREANSKVVRMALKRAG
jgi:integrase